jgi:hypothetical protein
MAFCNSCGTAMEAGSRFCPKCGAAAVGSAPAGAPIAAALIPAAPPAQGSSALKIILIVVAVIIGLGILGMGTLAFVVHRVVSRSHVVTQDGSVKVDTPFGSVESTQDPNVAAQNVGVDIYPGATVMKDGAANVTFGNMHTAAAEFETDDPVANVASFYKSKFPGANVMSSDDRYTILAGEKGNMTTITIEPRNGKTRIHVAKITGKPIGISN